MSGGKIPSLSDIKNLFENEDLFSQAMTHTSWINEHPDIRDHNERLEFLGDSILGFIIANHLYQKFHDQREGNLTQMKNNMEDNLDLAAIAHHLGMGDALYLGKGEEMSGGRVKEKILSGALEALIGALWLDQGLETASDLVRAHILLYVPETAATPAKHPKTRLQEYCQQSGKAIPEYQLVDESSLDNLTPFIVEVLIDGVSYGKGKGDKKQEAETQAAEEALDLINKQQEAMEP